MKSRFHPRDLAIAAIVLFLGVGLLALFGFHQLAHVGIPELRQALAGKTEALHLLDRMQTVARYYSAWVSVLTTAGLLLAVWFAHRITVYLVRPIERIERFVIRVSQGDLYRRLSRQEHAFLSRLAHACNRLVESLEQSTEQNRRRLSTERRLAVALIEVFDLPTLAVTPGGDIRLANSRARALLTHPDGDGLAAALRDCVAEAREAFEYKGTIYRVRDLSLRDAGAFMGRLIEMRIEDSKEPRTQTGQADLPGSDSTVVP